MDAIPRLSDQFIADLPRLSLQEIAFEVSRPYVDDDFSDERLREILDRSLTFPAPLHQLEDRTSMLELFHGPTLAFKDFGARFMAQVMGAFSERKGDPLTVLVATSGDTGSAVAQAFFNVPGTRVVVLYPDGKITDMQERQITTLGGNITALAVDGTFDDCQRLVKQAFGDTELATRCRLTSANSINIARLIPQMFYYFSAYAQLPDRSLPLVISVPSGNFGNLTAGLIAQKMGLPIHRFVAATNANDVVPQYLTTGAFRPRPSVTTYSNAMDVGNPSNFARMIDLYEGSAETMRSVMEGYSVSDDETADEIRRVYQQYDYVLDPHGAVALLGLRSFLSQQNIPMNGIAFATAHPAKFPAVVEKAIQKPLAIPEALTITLHKPKQSTRMHHSFASLKRLLLSSQ